MDTAFPQKFPFILDRNLAKANCTGNHVCSSCDKVVLGLITYIFLFSGSILLQGNLAGVLSPTPGSGGTNTPVSGTSNSGSTITLCNASANLTPEQLQSSSAYRCVMCGQTKGGQP